MAEFDLIERIRAASADLGHGVALGIGDDAAVLDVAVGQQLVVTTDTLVEGVHFFAGTDPADIGWKTLAVNLSDLAAMGAAPAWVVLNLTLPNADVDFVDDLLRGFVALAAQHGVALVGGDTCSGPRNLAVTAMGLVPRGSAMTRRGAQVGDAVYVTGAPGEALAGLDWLRAQGGIAAAARASGPAALACRRLLRPTPRVTAGLALRGVASACIDVSDGLVVDLAHVATGSGVAIELEVEALPISAALQALQPPPACFDTVLAGGDSYELAFTAPATATLPSAAQCGVAITRIGRVVAGQGVRVVRGGQPYASRRRGWEHFA